MSQGKPQRQLTMLRKIHHQEWTLQTLKDLQPPRVASQLSSRRPAAGNLHAPPSGRGRCPPGTRCRRIPPRDSVRWAASRSNSSAMTQEQATPSLSLIQTNSRKMLKLRVLPCTFCSIPLLELLLSALRCCGGNQPLTCVAPVSSQTNPTS